NLLTATRPAALLLMVRRPAALRVRGLRRHRRRADRRGRGGITSTFFRYFRTKGRPRHHRRVRPADRRVPAGPPPVPGRGRPGSAGQLDGEQRIDPDGALEVLQVDRLDLDEIA